MAPDFADHDFDPAFDDPAEPLEAYCVRCREMVEMEDPEPVWTRKGAPGTRGICPVCGATIFRMGRTEAHHALRQPRAIQVAGGVPHSRGGRPALAASATFVACARVDEIFAHRLADDLGHMGVPAYLPRATEEAVHWAGGVHPALEDCTRLLVILTAAVLAEPAARRAWEYFREHKKRIVVAQKEAIALPDALRRAARVDFTGDYRPALRQLVQALGE